MAQGPSVLLYGRDAFDECGFVSAGGDDDALPASIGELGFRLLVDFDESRGFQPLERQQQGITRDGLFRRI